MVYISILFVIMRAMNMALSVFTIKRFRLCDPHNLRPHTGGSGDKLAGSSPPTGYTGIWESGYISIPWVFKPLARILWPTVEFVNHLQNVSIRELYSEFQSILGLPYPFPVGHFPGDWYLPGQRRRCPRPRGQSVQEGGWTWQVLLRLRHH